ncbi:MAG TPA: DUF2332 family protein [Methylomirabilota bacterium]|nr:DUF2332 family protein [Methylomirabilota bacterium]
MTLLRSAPPVASTRLARSRGASELASYPPPWTDRTALWGRLEPAIARHDAFLCDRLDGPPQTNEVARSGAILGGLLIIAAATRRPLNLLEIGSSAGLNLGVDRYRYDFGDRTWGHDDAKVLVRCTWDGEAPSVDVPLEIIDRVGCDRAPLDPSSTTDRERLLSYIWADQKERLARTELALDEAAGASWRVESADAADWVEKQLAERRPPGQALVLMQSIVWQYLPGRTKDRIEAAILDAARRAGSDSPLAWLRMEYDGDHGHAGLYLTLWPGHDDRSLGRADFHGRWVHWEASPSRWRWR